MNAADFSPESTTITSDSIDFESEDVQKRCVATIRALAIDGIQKANSGHPGAPLGLAPIAHRLFWKHMKHDPTTPEWHDRDRFVLSCGHASMLLYSVLHLCGYDVTMDDLQSFRQLHSRTPGHPERGELPGVETTTGPLGQGFANAVGMAIAERMVAHLPAAPVTDHYTWVLASDGDMMEGVASEAASLAGHLGLGKLIVFYDDNRITIDGKTDISFSEDVGRRFEAYGWQVIRLDDVESFEAIDAAVDEARADGDRPALIVARTHIGYGSPLQDTSKVHGAPLGEDAVRETKKFFGVNPDLHFDVPEEVREAYAVVRDSGRQLRSAWQDACDAEGKPQSFDGRLPDGWNDALSEHRFEAGASLATRQASQIAINLIAPSVPNLVGGSADLAESNLTDIKDDGIGHDFSASDRGRRNIRFGIREHAMGAVQNGMLAHGGLHVFTGTFLVFSDYMRPAIRLAALMGLPATYVFTHDSVYLGEDGPTHQPVEHAWALRCIPGVRVIRPAEAVETLAAWEVAMQQSKPTALLLTRQKLPVLEGELADLARAGVRRGGYTLYSSSGDGEPDVILIGTGSEVTLCLQAKDALVEKGITANVVSMPSIEIFAEQTNEWKQQVLPPNVEARVAVEAGSTIGWREWVGAHGAVVGIDSFGCSAPGDQAAAALGINVEAVVRAAQESIENANNSRA